MHVARLLICLTLTTEVKSIVEGAGMQNQEVIIRNPLALNEDALGENVVVIDAGDYIFIDEPRVKNYEIPATDIHTTSR